VNRHKQIGAVLVGDLHAVVQRDKGIAGARQAGVDAVAAQNAAHVFSDRQHDMLLFRTVMADSAGINTAVARVEHHDAFAPAFFAAGLLCPLDVFNGCSFALTCEAIPKASLQPARLSAPDGAKQVFLMV
jgi:hypothetical protein